MSSARWKETNEPEVPPSPNHVFRWTPGDGWCPRKSGTLPAAAPAVLYSSQAASDPFLPKEISGLACHCGYGQVWGKTPNGCPAANRLPKAQGPCFLYSTLPVCSESGLKVPVQVGERGVAATPRTYPLLLPGNRQFPEASFPLPPLPRRGLWLHQAS